MNKEELQAALEAIARSGITVNGDLVLNKKVDYEVANVEAGGIGIQINNNYGGEMQTPLATNDKEIKEAIEELLHAKNEDGALLFRNKKQWWAVFRVLAEYLNYPQKITVFVAKMKDLGFDEKDKLDYESTRKTPQEVPQIATCSPSTWDGYKNINDNYRQQWSVADYLMQKLGIKA
ncbi:MAG: hypothetical protein IJS20_00800 [Bacteroidales bacterium]|nr:hypothetical protein [Bacteroidales bacterium]